MKREYRTVAELIKEERALAGLTQEETGNRAGIKAANLRKYESGRQTPKIETIARIAKGLGLFGIDISCCGDKVTYTALDTTDEEIEAQAGAPGAATQQ